MIQFRWREAEGPEEGVTTVDDAPCVLQYRIRFMPTVIQPMGGEPFVGLKSARDVDSQWKDIIINGV